jgi:AMMECR1 domain-containing protein
VSTPKRRIICGALLFSFAGGILLQLPSIAFSARSITLPQLVKMTLAHYFEEKPANPASWEQWVRSLPPVSQNAQPSGLFVTLSLNGKTRACWGSPYPKAGSLARTTVETTLDALNREYRYPPIQAHEWRKLKPQVTLIRKMEPVGKQDSLNPITEGLLVRSGGRSGVMLPGEAVDATYQRVQALLKAGISPKEPYQSYRLVSDIYD